MNKPTSNNAAAASSPSSPTSLNPNQLAELERLLATLTPATFAQLATAGRWQPARHLLYLDRALVDSIEAAARAQQDGALT